MKIGVVGGGTVGRATARTWLEHCDEVRIWDEIYERRTHALHLVLECDLLFICLPEDTVEPFLASKAALMKSPKGDYPYRGLNWVIKSTVPIGTTRRLRGQYGLPNLIHSPEFLTARCSLTDAQLPSRNIIGDPGFGPGLPEVCNASRLLNGILLQRFPGVPIFCMTSDESEAVKLVQNAFFAVKVAFFNEAWTLCDRLGLDWETVRGGVLSDGRIAHAHTAVPGPDGKRGFGGACLQKDALMFVEAFRDFEPEQEAAVVRAALARNKEDRK